LQKSKKVKQRTGGGNAYQINKNLVHIKEMDLKLVKMLGRGRFGEVWSALWRGTNKVAVKIVKVQNEAETHKFLKEIELQK